MTKSKNNTSVGVKIKLKGLNKIQITDRDTSVMQQRLKSVNMFVKNYPVEAKNAPKNWK